MNGPTALNNGQIIIRNYKYIARVWLKRPQKFIVKSDQILKDNGVAVITRTNLNVKINAAPAFKTFEYMDINIRSSSAELIHLIAVYRPPPSSKNKCTTNEFMTEFSSLLETVITKPGHLLIVGDFNFHYDNYNCPDRTKFDDLLSAMDLCQLVHAPTHEKGHTLDLVIVRASDNFTYDVSVRGELPSDHSLVDFHVQITCPAPLKSTVTRRCIADIDMLTLREKLSCLDDVAGADVASLSESYRNVVIKALDELAPVKCTTRSDKSRAPWLTAELLKERKLLRRLERKWVMSGLEIDRQLYKAQRSEYNHHTDQVKTAFHRDRIVNADLKQLFNIVDNLVAGKSSISGALPSNIPMEALPEKFSEFFNRKIMDLRDGFGSSQQHGTQGDSFENFITEFDIVPLEMVRRLVADSACKSCTLDPLPTRLLKQCLDQILPFITRLINMSLVSGVVPADFKTAIIRPLLKKPNLDPDILKNYRPVSNLSFLSKILEKVVKAQLDQHLSQHSLYAKWQSAYRAHHSTETALLRVHNDIMISLDKQKEVVLVLLDLSAAFDTLDHDVLLHGLEYRFGISGTFLQWFRSYLSERRQCVSVGSFMSGLSLLICGVPQGSVLGPILFTLYTSPLEEIIQRHDLNCMFYADDTQLYITCDAGSSVSSSLELCIREIREWMKANFLVLNDSKTDVIHFTSRFKRVDKLHSLRVGEADVSASDVVKNLGVVLDQFGSMEAQIKQIIM